VPSSGLLQRIWRARTIYLFISPFFALFAIFQFFPLVWSFYMSFHEWNGLGPMEPIGLQNYRFLLRRDKAVRELLAELTGESSPGFDADTIEEAADAAFGAENEDEHEHHHHDHDHEGHQH